MITHILLTLIFNFLIFPCGGNIVIEKPTSPNIDLTSPLITQTPSHTKTTEESSPSPLIPKPNSLSPTPTDLNEELALVSILNEHRKQAGLNTLKISPTLNLTSQWMSHDLAFTYPKRNSLSHTDSLLRDPFKRMSDLGYDYSTTKAENLFAGDKTAQTVFEAWKNSPGHNQNMLNANVKVIGISRVYNADSIYKYYWTANFGGFDDSK